MDELLNDLFSADPALTPVRRLCPDCQVELERTVPRFGLTDSPGDLFSEPFYLDIYTCPRCGLVRFYSYQQRRDAEEAAKAAAQPAPPPPAEAKPHQSADPWEKKGLFRRKKDKPDWEE